MTNGELIIKVVGYVGIVTIGKLIISRKADKLIAQKFDTMYAKELEKQVDPERKQKLLNEIKANATK